MEGSYPRDFTVLESEFHPISQSWIKRKKTRLHLFSIHFLEFGNRMTPLI